jgi:hypothetical protein
MKKFLLLLALSLPVAADVSGQTRAKSPGNPVPTLKFSVSTTYLSFLNFGDEKVNTHHYEFHFGYRLTLKDKISIKVATWKMFAPMGMPMQEQLKFDERNFYPGRLSESGLGISYQRMIWKGLFATVELLPQIKTYLDENNHKIGNGFKLYTSYHLGYHIPFFNNRIFIEPQIHCQYWPINTRGPQGFADKDSKWNNYFLFEPNIYIGVSF